jgi:acetyl-CoA C-acetyltransferase/acetyl-CoA acyltransferase
VLDIAIVDGVRTPFIKAFGPMANVPAHELGRVVASKVMEKAQIRPEQVDQVIFGNVVIPAEAANPARVIALQAGIPHDRVAHTVSRNCAAGTEALTGAAQLIQVGEARVVLAGGTEAMSQIPLILGLEATNQFLKLARAHNPWRKLRALMGFRPRHFKPIPAIKQGLTDPVSGMLMGETAEVLAEEFAISRRAQDEYAMRSHHRAAAAQQRCFFSEEIVPVSCGAELKKDIGPRAKQTLEALGKLKPYFRENGSVTIGNSCSLTDGAAAVILMPGAAARAAGLKPLGYLRAYAYAGCDPRRMGLGPVLATNKVLQKTGLALKDIELIELNEAFAAQVLADEIAFASDRFAQQELGRSKALGELDWNRVNVNGGAIALGHPMGATGVRQAITVLKEMARRGLHRGLATLCIGGGQGGALLLERDV